MTGTERAERIDLESPESRADEAMRCLLLSVTVIERHMLVPVSALMPSLECIPNYL